MGFKIAIAIIITLTLIGLLTYLVVDLVRQIKRIHYAKKGIKYEPKRKKKQKDIDYE